MCIVCVFQHSLENFNDMCAWYIVEYATQMSCQHINKNSSFKGANKIIGTKHGTMTKV